MLHKFTLVLLFAFLTVSPAIGQSSNSSWNSLVVSYAKNNAISTEIDYVLGKGGDVNAQDKDGVTALMWYAYHRNFIMVEYLMKLGANPLLKGVLIPYALEGSKLYYGHALAAAVGAGDYGSINALMKAGFPIDEPGRSPDGKKGYNALHVAAFLGNYDMVVHLLYRLKDQGFATANPNIACEADSGKTALMLAMQNGHKDVVQLLVKAGGRVASEISNSKSVNALIEAVRSKQSVGEIEQLLASGTDINSRDENGATAVMWAAYLNDTEILKFLLAKGARARLKGVIYNPLPGARFPYFGNALAAAIGNGSNHTAQVLLRKGGIRFDEPGISPNGKETSWSAIQIGAYENNLLISNFMNTGFSLNFAELSPPQTACDFNKVCIADNKLTPLMYAAQAGRAEFVERLLSRGADPLFTDAKGWTFLHHAAKKGDIKIVKAALETGLLASQKTLDGQTAISIASSNKHTELIDFFKKAGVNEVKRNKPLTLESIDLNEEVREVKKYYQTPSLQADGFDQMATLYDRMGYKARSTRYVVEASLAREQEYQEIALPTFRSLAFELGNFDKELQREVEPIVKKVEKAMAGGCRNIASARREGQDLTAYALHRLASEYHVAYAQCLAEKKEWQDLFDVLRTLAYNQKALGKFDESEATLTKASKLALEHSIGKRSIENGYALALIDLGRLQLFRAKIFNISNSEQTEQIEKAQVTLERADSCLRAIGPNRKLNRGVTLALLTEAYELTNDIRILQVAGAELAQFSESNINIQYWLGMYHLKNDNLSESFAAFKKGLEQCRSKFGIWHPYYMRLLDGMSRSYRKQNRLVEAKSFLIQAVETATALSYATNLIIVQDPVREAFSHWNDNFNQEFGSNRIKRKYDAYELNEQVVELSERAQIADLVNQSIIASDHHDYQVSSELLAKAYDVMMQSDRAYDTYLVTTTFLLAEATQRAGKQQEASHFYEIAYEDSRDLLGSSNINHIRAIHLFSRAMAAQGNSKRADHLLREGWGLLKDRLNSQINTLSESDFILAKRELDRFLEFHTDFYAKTAAKDTASAARLYEIALLQKGLALRSYAGFLQQVSSRFPKEVAGLKTLQKYRTQRILAEKNEDKNWRNELDSLNNLLGETERKLLSLVSSKPEIGKSYTWKDVRRMLVNKSKANKGVAVSAVELIQYKEDDNEQKYGALVLNQLDSSPHFTVLSSEKQWQTILSKLADFNPESVDAFYKNKQLYELAWQPIEKVVSKSKIVYLSAAQGYSQGLSFPALKKPDNTSLGSGKIIRMVLSTSQIETLNNFNLAQKPIKALLVGAVDYKCDGEQLFSKPLLRAGEEVAEIGQIIEKAKGKYDLLKNDQATEPAFTKATEQPYNLIHLATHGKSMKRKVASATEAMSTFARQQDPGFHSALLMSGSDCAWSNQKQLGDDDGVLTVKEIQSTIALRADLVVLSACQSALGDSEGSEGLLGLYRAFKSAGAVNVLASLWDVDDASASQFMRLFYNQLALPNATTESAFEAAQSKMRNTPGVPVSSWAGFVLMR